MAKGFDSTSDSSKLQSKGCLSPAIDAEAIQQQWQEQFAGLEDPRGRQGIEHPFLSIVIIGILAVIGGARGWEDIETYAESHEAWLSTLLSLPNGVPKADTYRQLFERIDPEALESCFLE